MEDGDDKRMYFVLETKGSAFEFDMRSTERLKFNCGRAHFRALDGDVKTRLTTKWSEVGV
ncbi:MAG: hypothetical protein FWF81_04475 [Defluviitaleaceae bacterium]|nr:hypothetical protein [Defluviitaleaceae bacterium]